MTYNIKWMVYRSSVLHGYTCFCNFHAAFVHLSIHTSLASLYVPYISMEGLPTTTIIWKLVVHISFIIVWVSGVKSLSAISLYIYHWPFITTFCSLSCNKRQAVRTIFYNCREAGDRQNWRSQTPTDTDVLMQY